MRRGSRFLILGLLVFCTQIGLALADNIFVRGSSALYRNFQNPGMQAAITIFLIWLILYSILVVAVKNAKIFSDNGAVNKSGKIFALSVSLLAVIGLFFAGRTGMDNVVRKVLSVTKIYGIVALCIIIFILTYNLLRGGKDE